MSYLTWFKGFWLTLLLLYRLACNQNTFAMKKRLCWTVSVPARSSPLPVCMYVPGCKHETKEKEKQSKKTALFFFSFFRQRETCVNNNPWKVFVVCAHILWCIEHLFSRDACVSREVRESCLRFVVLFWHLYYWIGIDFYRENKKCIRKDPLGVLSLWWVTTHPFSSVKHLDSQSNWQEKREAKGVKLLPVASFMEKRKTSEKWDFMWKKDIFCKKKGRSLRYEMAFSMGWLVIRCVGVLDTF